MPGSLVGVGLHARTGTGRDRDRWPDQALRRCRGGVRGVAAGAARRDLRAARAGTLRGPAREDALTGHAQRLGLAKALLPRSELLILDEPSNGLDPAGVAEIRELLHNLSREHGVTVLPSSHLLTEVARLATRIGIIHKGRLMREAGTGEVATRLRVATRDLDAAAPRPCVLPVSIRKATVPTDSRCPTNAR